MLAAGPLPRIITGTMPAELGNGMLPHNAIH